MSCREGRSRAKAEERSPPFLSKADCPLRWSSAIYLRQASWAVFGAGVTTSKFGHKDVRHLCRPAADGVKPPADRKQMVRTGQNVSARSYKWLVQGSM